MSFVAVGIVGAGVITAYTSDRASSRAASTTERASQYATDATVQSTRLQLEEIQRQFDYQQAILQPFLQRQNQAGQAYSNLLGYSTQNTPALPAPPSAGGSQPSGTLPGVPNLNVIGQTYNPSTSLPSSYRTPVGPNGFVDPNLNPATFGRASARDTELGSQAFMNVLADPNIDTDTLMSYLRASGLAGTPEGDAAIRRASDVRLRNVFGGDEARTRAATALNAGPEAGDLGLNTARNNRLGTMLTGTEAQDRVAGNQLRSTFTGNEALDRANDVRLATPGGYRMDPRFQFARDTAVVGDNFQTSPGYAFTVEQAMREVERRNSAGGNFGGRALLEAQRRAEGVAAGEYYNWVGARNADLQRQDAALAAYQGREATDVARGDVALQTDLARRMGASQYDISRGDAALDADIARKLAAGQFDISREDQAVRDYLARRGIDISRGDQAVEADLARMLAASQVDIGRGDAALADYRRREELDRARVDAGYENYFQRRGADLTRQDTAILQNQQAQQYDQQRQDQAYYNYLAQLAAAGGINIGAPQAVGSSSAAGAQATNAYANQGNVLAGIYQRQGDNAANIQLGNAANINNAFQNTVGNWLTYQYLNTPPPPVPGTT